MKHTIFITGAAGYVGAMLCDQFSKRDDVSKIIALDKEPKPELLAGNEKIIWITANTADLGWQEAAASHKPDIVIHTAWEIREMYGKQDIEWKWNVGGSNNVFDFALKAPSVTRLIHFSTAAVYGAHSTNSLSHYFIENEPLREEEYSYAREKIQVEKDLKKKWEEQNRIAVAVVRPVAITGPRGRFMRVRFGLQSALSGQLKWNMLYRIISLMVSFVPATPGWVRQFVHEDDVADIVALLAFEKQRVSYGVFNLAPPGEPVYALQMAEAVDKRTLRVFPWMVRFAYFFFWHVTRGRVPTGKGVWRFYSYPVLLNGSKIAETYSFAYKYNSRDAFRKTVGRYEQYI